jgi:uncharacterized protein YbcC (UPF0753/DUF2309 family)
MVKVGEEEKLFLTFAYWKEFFYNETSSQFQSNLEQTFLAWWEFIDKFIEMKVEVLFKGGIIT